MALWLCRLDAPQAGATCGVGGWLLPTDLNPDGVEPPSRWELYLGCGAGLPFVLECRLVAWPPVHATSAGARPRNRAPPGHPRPPAA
ncbi:MAG: hypothetical protein ACKOPS_05155 [Cyanobium sp.]